MARLVLALFFSFTLSAGRTLAAPIEWNVTGKAGLNYKLVGTHWNVSLIGGNLAADAEALLATHLATITAGGDNDFLLEMMSMATEP